MSTADLGRALEDRYRFDDARRVFRPRQEKPFAYSDGAASEAHIAAAIDRAADLRVGSAQLACAIRDWPSQYHLSPARANLLRPLASAFGNRVLEIGAGCGVITRYLGESGATVLAIEGSLERATIAASRCRDLPNVLVVCDNVVDLDVPFAFDFVTLIGVLEYSRMFAGGPDPVQAMLALAMQHLAATGTLALAIENQLGLKYLAGAPEDHAGEAYFGVTNRYGPATTVTFGRHELQQRLERAGFAAIECLYPFPDYKLPAVVVTESGFREPHFGVADLIATSHFPRAGGEGPRAFSESLARDVFLRNGLGPATANSFLFMAAKSAPARAAGPAILAHAYSTARQRCFARETLFVSSPQGLVVKRRPLFDAPAPDGMAARQVLVASEPYVPGENLYRGLERIVARPDWTIDDLCAWADPWLRLVQELAKARQKGPTVAHRDDMPIDPGLFDCTPFNVVRRAGDGKLIAFDLEWQAAGRDALTLAQVAFRGLWNCLLRVEGFSPPAGDVPRDVASIVAAVLERLGIHAPPARMLDWIGRERAFTGAVCGCDPGDAPAVHRIRVRGEAAQPATERVARLERELDINRSRLIESQQQASRESGQNARLAARVAELEAVARRRQDEIVRLDRILAQAGHRFVSRLGAMLEPFPRVRALLRAPLNFLDRLLRKP